ncbi:MAG: peptidylprolyl isomerase [Parachlamydiaceae bacterium]
MMLKKIYLSLFTLLCLCSPLVADLLMSRENEPKLVINNRVLIRVNGKAITVMDVMKRMDIHFLRQYPEFTTVDEARYQFYESNWEPVLEELITKELILADAEENKVTVSSGDIRQEMEQYFGPNIIENLDKIGLSFDEAYKMVEGELIVRRMLSVRVHNKVQGNVTPHAIKQHYDEFAKNNIRKESFRYQVVTIKHTDPNAAKAIAELAYDLLVKKSVSLDTLKSQPKLIASAKDASITISNDLTHQTSDLADIIKTELLRLSPNTFSSPFAQKSRADRSTIFRIVYLKEKTPEGPIPFSEAEMTIRDHLLDTGMANESETYVQRLKKHFDIEDNQNIHLHTGFKPFSLKR